MAKELASIDVSDQPELLHLAREVQTSQQPRILRGNGKDLAILTPVPRSRRRSNRGRVLRPDDSLFQLIGAAASSEGEPTDVSSNKHRYLAEAYAKHSE